MSDASMCMCIRAGCLQQRAVLPETQQCTARARGHASGGAPPAGSSAQVACRTERRDWRAPVAADLRLDARGAVGVDCSIDQDGVVLLEEALWGAWANLHNTCAVAVLVRDGEGVVRPWGQKGGRRTQGEHGAATARIPGAAAAKLAWRPSHRRQT